MILGLVCARAGSAGLPGKNLLKLDGRPLIERAIDTAFAACDDVAVSTDYSMAQFDPRGAFYVKRPDTLAGPRVGKWPAYRHAVREYEEATGRIVSMVVDVDVTRPLRSVRTVRSCIAAAETFGVSMAVAQTDKHPAFDILRREGDTLTRYEPSSFEARQEVPPAYLHAGCYAISRAVLDARESLFDGRVVPVEVDRRESYDIDDALDWTVVRALYAAA